MGVGSAARQEELHGVYCGGRIIGQHRIGEVQAVDHVAVLVQVYPEVRAPFVPHLGRHAWCPRSAFEFCRHLRRGCAQEVLGQLGPRRDPLCQVEQALVGTRRKAFESHQVGGCWRSASSPDQAEDEREPRFAHPRRREDPGNERSVGVHGGLRQFTDRSQQLPVRQILPGSSPPRFDRSLIPGSPLLCPPLHRAGEHAPHDPAGVDHDLHHGPEADRAVVVGVLVHHDDGVVRQHVAASQESGQGASERAVDRLETQRLEQRRQRIRHQFDDVVSHGAVGALGESPLRGDGNVGVGQRGDRPRLEDCQLAFGQCPLDVHGQLEEVCDANSE